MAAHPTGSDDPPAPRAGSTPDHRRPHCNESGDPRRARTVLFTPIGFNLAEVTRMIEVARALPATLTPVFLAHDTAHLDHVRTAGFPLLHGTAELTAAQVAQVMALDQERGIRHPFTAELVEARVAREREAIQQTGAVAVVHGTNPTSTISARAEGIPLFYPVPFALSRPAFDAGLVAPVLPGRTVGRWLNPLLTPLFDRVFSRWPLTPRGVIAVARRHGVDLSPTLAEFFRGDVTLLTSTAFEVADAALPPDHRLIGPIFAHLPGEVPGIVRELAAGSQPLVYMAFGSSGTRALARAAMRAVAGLPVQVVAPIRGLLKPGDEHRVPPNVHLVDLLPAHRLGGLVDAAVLHGGQGTVQTAQATGVPFIGMGLSTEQRWNVAEAARRGSAIELFPSDLQGDARRFRRALYRVLFEDEIRDRARTIQAEDAQEDGAARAAEIITAELGG
ncbi:MAG: hypothetical protein Q4G40_02155 [Brachybacterium sp.]|nr:hypothetical protein [Brachybacterium sp.]